MKQEQSRDQGGYPQEAPNVTEFTTLSTIYSGRVGRLGCAISAKARGTLGSVALATLGHRGGQYHMCC